MYNRDDQSRPPFVTCNKIPFQSFVLKMAVFLWNLNSQGHNHYKLKYIPLEKSLKLHSL